MPFEENMQLNETLFQKNCELWSAYYPKEAFFLGYHPIKNWLLETSEKGEPNARSLLRQLPLHDPKGSAQAEQAWFDQLPLKGCRVLYIYGVGLGYTFAAAKKWLKGNSKRELIFMEDDLEVIALGMRTPLFHELLSHPQVRLMYLPEDLDKEKELFDQLFWIHAGSRSASAALPAYKMMRMEKWESIQQQLAYNASIKTALLEEYLHYGIGFYRNFYPNLLQMPRASWAEHLYGAFTGIPAIICGAGPSLKRVLPVLEELKQKAVLFAGGSALNALFDAAITPHFAAGIDPNPSQYRRLQHSQLHQTPFFYRSRLFYHALRALDAPLLYVPGAGGYMTATWIEEKLGLEGETLDEGHNVVNFCIELAYRLGCSPIYLVGVDLALTEGKYYAPGLDHTSAPDVFDAKGVIAPEQKDFVTHLDIFGKPVTTRWPWLAESKWVSDFAYAHPDVKLINATGSGIGFLGVNNIEPESLVDQLNVPSHDLNGYIHTLVAESRLKDVTEEKMIELLQELQASLKRCIDYLNILFREGELLITRLEASQKLPEFLQSGQAALAEAELVEEPAYQAILDSFNILYSRLLNQPLKLMRRRRYSALRKKIKEQELNQKLLNFLRNTARANLALISWTLNNYRHEQKV